MYALVALTTRIGSVLKEKKIGPNSTRILRVHENAARSITDIKLPVTSLRTKVEANLSLPTTLNEVTAAVRREIGLLEPD